jgi:hypothetical protein
MSMPISATTPERILLRLDWNVIRRLDGLLQGDYRSLFYGFGVDFADLREYLPEDDIRYIDWNVTARMNTPYVRQYHEDREITAWFLLDMSPSVDFGVKDLEKRFGDRSVRRPIAPGSLRRRWWRHRAAWPGAEESIAAACSTFSTMDPLENTTGVFGEPGRIKGRASRL